MGDGLKEHMHIEMQFRLWESLEIKRETDYAVGES